jgi:CMP-N-acetylneuraminic acid synthetase
MSAPRIVVQVPLKFRSSERIPNKNFHPFHGRPLSHWVLSELAAECPGDWDLFIDSEREEVLENLSVTHRSRFAFHRRPDWYASNEANGNHLLQQFVAAHPDYDYYVQVYVTAVLLKGSTVVRALDALRRSDGHDSVLLASRETGFIWFNGAPVNYEPRVPAGLRRSQDICYLKETTGLYAVTRHVALSTGCRVGHAPLFFLVPKIEALDIDTVEDLQIAERLFEHRHEAAA